MAGELAFKAFVLKAPDQDTIKQMIHIYQEAYKNDKTVQLKYILPNLIDRMAETIALRLKQPEWEFIVARTESTNHIVGWIALAFKLEKHRQISEGQKLRYRYN